MANTKKKATKLMCKNCDIGLHELKVKPKSMKYSIVNASLTVNEPCTWEFYDDNFQDDGVLMKGNLWYCPNCREVKFYGNNGK